MFGCSKERSYYLISIFDLNAIKGLENDVISIEDLWRAMQSLPCVRRLEIGCKNDFVHRLAEREEEIPNNLFQSAGSVKLMGHMQPNGIILQVKNSIHLSTMSFKIRGNRRHQESRDPAAGRCRNPSKPCALELDQKSRDLPARRCRADRMGIRALPKSFERCIAWH